MALPDLPVPEADNLFADVDLDTLIESVLADNHLLTTDAEQLLPQQNEEGGGGLIELFDDLQADKEDLSEGASMGSSNPSDTTADSLSPPSSASLPSPSASEADEDDLCHVCGRPTGRKCLFYGGKACYSCRTFFKRSVHGRKHETYQCKARGAAGAGAACSINSQSWKSCRKCRFERCLRANMQPKLVMTQEQKELVHARLQEERALVARRKADARVRILMTPSDKATLEEKILMAGYHQLAVEHTVEVCTQFWKANVHLFEGICAYLETGRGPVDQVTTEQLKRFSMSVGSSFYRRLGDFSCLDPADQEVLLDANYPAIVFLVHAAFHFSQTASQEHSANMINYINKTAREGKDPGVDYLARRLNSLNLQDRQLPQPLYDFFSTKEWRVGSASTERFKEIIRIVSRWATARGDTAGNPDTVQLSIMVLVLLFSGEGLPLLRKRAQVDALQAKYMHLLLRYLKEVEPGYEAASRKFREAVYLGGLLREANRIQNWAASMEERPVPRLYFM